VGVAASGKDVFRERGRVSARKDQTIVALSDDGDLNTAAPAANNPSEVYLYIGNKQTQGNEIERAGLTNGKLYGVKVVLGDTHVTEESNDFGLGSAATGFAGSGRFELVELGSDGDVSGFSGLQLSQDSIAKGVFRMMRPEDGAWDPRGMVRTRSISSPRPVLVPLERCVYGGFSLMTSAGL